MNRVWRGHLKAVVVVELAVGLIVIFLGFLPVTLADDGLANRFQEYNILGERSARVERSSRLELREALKLEVRDAGLSAPRVVRLGLEVFKLTSELVNFLVFLCS